MHRVPPSLCAVLKNWKLQRAQRNNQLADWSNLTCIINLAPNMRIEKRVVFPGLTEYLARDISSCDEQVWNSKMRVSSSKSHQIATYHSIQQFHPSN
jgi:hypothetical protein